ncbi:MAG TPA: LLM class flavin-dependent oxidoreductase [Acidimicrobiales bacterium]|nr:LLM class flavin-dependent oxidoreductase [Acidimicrobiales bacterium]
MKVRFAVAPLAGAFDPEAFLALVEGLEARHFDTLWLSDVPLAPSVDPIVGLTAAAGRTLRLKLGANLVPLGRNPLLLAKQLAEIDRLSHGRLLLSLVPGLGSPAERSALGVAGVDRGAVLEEEVALLRRLWSGETVDHHSERFELSSVRVSPKPVQDPLEIWLGGSGRRALERAGRIADGWLGAALTAAEAEAARVVIEDAAARAGRRLDPEHFGLSIPYARGAAPAEALEQVARRRPDLDPSALLPAGGAALRSLLASLVAAGLSKFVLRPVSVPTSVDEELDWLGEAGVLDLQS